MGLKSGGLQTENQSNYWLNKKKNTPERGHHAMLCINKYSITTYVAASTPNQVVGHQQRLSKFSAQGA
jgi:hypothetical protein